MNKLKQYLGLCLLLLVLSSCDNDGCREDVGFSEQKVTLVTNRLDLKLYESKHVDLFKEEEVKYIEFLEAKLVPAEMTNKFLEYAGHSEKINELRDVAKADFKNNEALDQSLGEMYSRLKVYYPSFEVPEINYVFTAFGDIHIVDYKGIIYVGTEYFIHNKDKFPIPSDYFPQYISNQMTKAYLPSKIGMLHSNEFNKVDLTDKSLLNEMIAYGKVYYFVGQLLPCAPESVLMSRSAVDITNFEKHKKDVWNHMVKNQLFFKEDSETKRKYIEPRPKTVEIADECPGMVGQWLGYEIVKSYMKNNEVSLQELMNITDAKTIFNKSGFKSEVK